MVSMVSMAIHGAPGMSMVNYGEPWETMVNYGYPCLAMFNHDQPWLTQLWANFVVFHSLVSCAAGVQQAMDFETCQKLE